MKNEINKIANDVIELQIKALKKLKSSLDKSSMFGSSKKYLFITYENLTKKLQ